MKAEFRESVAKSKITKAIVMAAVIALAALGIYFSQWLFNNAKMAQNKASVEGAVSTAQDGSFTVPPTPVSVMEPDPAETLVKGICADAAKAIISTNLASNVDVSIKVKKITYEGHDLCVVGTDIKKKFEPNSNSTSVTLIGEVDKENKTANLLYLDWNALKVAANAFEGIYKEKQPDSKNVHVNIYMYDEKKFDANVTMTEQAAAKHDQDKTWMPLFIDVKPIKATFDSVTFSGFIKKQQCFVTVKVDLSPKENVHFFSDKKWHLVDNLVTCQD